CLIDPAQLPQVLPVLTDALHTRHPISRRDAIWAIGNIGVQAQEAGAALIALLLDRTEDPNIRSEALRALTSIGLTGEELVVPLIQMLTDEHERLRCDVVQALGRLGPQAATSIPQLVKKLADDTESFRVRLHTAFALAAIGTPEEEVLAALEHLLHHESWWLRVIAVRALATLRPGSLSVLPALIAALQDLEWNVQRNAICVLARLGEQATPAIPALQTLLTRPALCGLAAQALASIGHPALPVLLDELETSAEPFRSHVAYALLKLDTPEARARVQQVMGEHFTFIPPLEDFLFPEPPLELPDEKRQAFEALYEQAVHHGTGALIDYTLPYPKYDFLRYISQTYEVIFHGSNHPDLEVLSPIRYGSDIVEQLDVHGIFADPDGIRPLYFAIMDRQRLHWLYNGYLNLPTSDGTIKRFYQFAIDAESLYYRPWTHGMLYILPRQSFSKIREGEWICREVLRPLARLPIAPEDFPFLSRIMGTDDHLGIKLITTFEEALAGFIYLDDVQNNAVRP
ncbi:MAG TPA: HEAT repeat domain-containing protein, partial [Ktedonobacteraceae bacterium]|nr:HEAT repeat domain-containing protein [Ktedonobacteraceae bacterium]